MVPSNLSERLQLNLKKHCPSFYEQFHSSEGEGGRGFISFLEELGILNVVTFQGSLQQWP